MTTEKCKLDTLIQAKLCFSIFILQFYFFNGIPRSRLSLECQCKEALPRYLSGASVEEAGASNADDSRLSLEPEYIEPLACGVTLQSRLEKIKNTLLIRLC